MREQYREILEEAVAASANREDFDEMLLRVTKKHLPVRYQTHFIAMLEDILKEAENKGVTNRQAALEILKETLPVTPKEVKGPAAVSAVPPKEKEAPDSALPAPAPSPQDSAAPEAPKILDLGGMRPETLPPEVKDKLSKMVKVQKKKAEWDDDSGGEVDPVLFFKGSQRCPPPVPAGKPKKGAGEKDENEIPEKEPDKSEEE
jgi:hypothetical protein